jgi:TetR/AcrR family transcriptional regulator, transcriptional repressor for nem operon
MARSKAFDRDVALGAAIGVFREHGFEGTSADMLVAAMGIGRQSLYDTFGDKWRLYCSAVERYAQAETFEHRAALRSGPRAIDGLKAMMDRVVAEADQACLGVGSICEFGRTRGDLTRIHEAAWQALQPALIEHIEQAKTEGDLSTATDAEAAADFLNANMAGIRIAARGGAGRSRLQTLAEMALRSMR